MLVIQSAAAMNVAVVGCGIRGQLFATALTQMPNVVLTAVVDASDNRARDLAEAVGALAYPTVTEMLDGHPEINAAIIATPDFAHTDVAVECASRGLHLMIEKPLATDVTSAKQIVDAANTHNTLVMVAFENRWNPRFIETRRLINDGAIGGVSNMIAQLNDTIYVPTKMLAWAGESSPAWFLMPHTLDLALWFKRATPVDVYAKGTRGVLDKRGINTWDAITAIFGLSDGTTLTLHSSWVLPESQPAVYDLRYDIQGSSGVLALDGANHGMTLYGPDRASWPQLGVHWRRDEIRGFPIDMVNDFISYVRGESVEVPTAQDGLTVTVAIEAVHDSLKSNASVVIST